MTRCADDSHKELLKEYQELHRKYELKVEALVYVSQDYARCQEEKEKQSKQLSETTVRVSALREALEIQKAARERTTSETSENNQNLLMLLKSLKTENSNLGSANEELRLKLRECEGDVKVLRQQLARERLKSDPDNFSDLESVYSEPMAGPSTAADLSDRERIHTEQQQLERDLKLVLCEKEDIVIERDAYKTKTDRLNQELTFIASGDNRSTVLDIDALLMENRYLKEQLRSAHEETGLAKAAMNKYKSLLDRRKKKPDGLVAAAAGSEAIGGVAGVITPKQVAEILQDHSSRRDVDYRALASALLDAVNDKNMALSHQRKANKILGQRVTELEAKLKSVELSAFKSPGNISALPLSSVEANGPLASDVDAAPPDPSE